MIQRVDAHPLPKGVATCRAGSMLSKNIPQSRPRCGAVFPEPCLWVAREAGSLGPQSSSQDTAESKTCIPMAGLDTGLPRSLGLFFWSRSIGPICPYAPREAARSVSYPRRMGIPISKNQYRTEQGIGRLSPTLPPLFGPLISYHHKPAMPAAVASRWRLTGGNLRRHQLETLLSTVLSKISAASETIQRGPQSRPRCGAVFRGVFGRRSSVSDFPPNRKMNPPGRA